MTNKYAMMNIALLAALLLLGNTAIAAVAPIPSTASPEVYKLIAENDQWRVFRATWQPGQEDNFHSHSANRVSVFGTDCDLRLTKPDGKSKDVHPKAGKAKARSGKAVNSHKAKNIGDKACVITIVELK